MHRVARSGATILIADDRLANRKVLSKFLESAGYQTLHAADGREALEMLRTRSVDLALLDVMMPGCSGFTVCREAKSDPATRMIPIVMVTGLRGTRHRVQGIDCGADDFLSKPANRDELLARVRSLLRIKQFTDELESAETVLMSLATGIEAKDPYTVGHCERLSVHGAAMARRMGLSEELQTALRRGGIVHDLGKIAVPDQILLKPGPLTREERRIMEKHPLVGERICAPLKSFRNVLPIIRHHHERLDGSGYPDGLKGEAIPLTARVLGMVDVFDALTSERSYHQAMPQDEALAIIRWEVKRGLRDADLLEELEAMLAEVESSLVPLDVA